jgi:uncharacterized protein (UPF0332 family)
MELRWGLWRVKACVKLGIGTVVPKENCRLATWDDLSDECIRAAKRLLADNMWRRSINASYYGAYSAVTGKLVAAKVTFARGWNNPAHEQLPDLILNHIRASKSTRREMRRAIRRLRMAREDADYRPGVSVDRQRALDCLHDAADVVRWLAVMEDRDE